MSASAAPENRIGKLLLGGSIGLIGLNLFLLPAVLFLGVFGDVPGGHPKRDFRNEPELVAFLPPPPPPEMREPGPRPSSLDRSISMLYAGAGDLMADLSGGDLP
jgi:hypothetical protein